MSIDETPSSSYRTTEYWKDRPVFAVDRRKILAQRQNLRDKLELTGKNQKKKTRSTKADTSTNTKKTITQTKQKSTKPKEEKLLISQDENDPKIKARLLRQVLHRKLYGDTRECIKKTSKTDLVQQNMDLAELTLNLKVEKDKVVESLKNSEEDAEKKFHAVASDLVQLQTKLQDVEKEKSDLLNRFEMAEIEYRDLIAYTEEKKQIWSVTAEEAKRNENDLKTMSVRMKEASEQIAYLSHELQKATLGMEAHRLERAEARGEENALKQERNRLENELKLERKEREENSRENDAKDQEIERLIHEIEQLRSKNSTFCTEIQVEKIAKQSMQQERDALYAQLQRDRSEMKDKEDKMEEHERRIGREIRSLEVEVRQQKQCISRLRLDLETEKTAREKAETSVLKLSQALDEMKATHKTLQEEADRAKMDMEEEKSIRTQKDEALHSAVSDLRNLQKKVRSEETLRIQAQNEVKSLNDRIKTMRREHLALLHRVETPYQLPSRWTTSGTSSDDNTRAG